MHSESICSVFSYSVSILSYPILSILFKPFKNNLEKDPWNGFYKQWVAHHGLKSTALGLKKRETTVAVLNREVFNTGG